MSQPSLSTLRDSDGLSDWIESIGDPVEQLLLTGRARTVHEAEEMHLESAYPQVLTLLASSLTDEELGRHPLFVMFRSHGSRPREDSLL